MPIAYHCESCGHEGTALEKHRGKQVSCPQCRAPLVIGAAASQQDAEQSLGDDEAPTAKQIAYAKRLGVALDPQMSKWDVSAAISAAEKLNPAAAANRETISRKRRAAEFGEELVALEDTWNQFAEETEFALAIYRGKKSIMVDVLRINEAWFNKKKQLILGVVSPIRRKEKYIGEYLEWDRDFELPAADLLWHEPLVKDFWERGVEKYQETVRRGLRRARDLFPGAGK